MSNDSFKVKKSLTLTPQDLTLLVNPEAGDLACDINDLNKIKRYDANSLGWTEVGSGGVGNVNALLTQTFDTAALAQFTQTGLALTTSNPIDGTQSARLIHQAASSQSFKQVIAVDRKYRGDLMAMSLQVRSSATSGNLTLLVTDETNSAVIMASSSISTGQYQVATAVTNTTTTISGFSNVDINLLKVGMTITGSGIPTATVISSINTAANTIIISQAATASATITAKFSALPDRKSFSFVIPTNCANLSYTVTALQEAGLPESYVDDIVIELANVSLLETSVTVPNITEWQTYTPTWTVISGTNPAIGNGSIVGKWRQVGENAEITFTINSGTTTTYGSGVYTVSLPSGLTIDTTKESDDYGTSNIYNNAAGFQGYIGKVIRNTATSVRFIGTGISLWSNVAPVTLAAATAGHTLTANFAVPCAGLSASSSVSIPLTQSGLVQEADSYVRVKNTVASFGSTTFSGYYCYNLNAGISSLGSDITIDNSTAATNGTLLRLNKTGTYQVNFTAFNIADTDEYIMIWHNSTQLAGQRIGSGLGDANGNVSATVYGVAGDVIRLLAEGNNTIADPGVIVSRQGSLKQVTVNANSRITIPTSELRFEGASTRGSTDTAIVKFDTQAKIRGDAFSVVNTVANGTVITMLKAGKLEISTSLYNSVTAGVVLAISKNQAILTSRATASETLSTVFSNSVNNVFTISANTFVNIGDIIRINVNAVPTADQANCLNLSFQEQEIQVSVSNTLPQFSESDSCVRLTGGNGFGSSATTTRRFASVIQNLGTDIEYTDSPTLGGQFIAKANGIYNVSCSDASSVNSATSQTLIYVNSSYVAFDGQTYNTASTAQKDGSLSWQGYLVAGDIVTVRNTTPSIHNALALEFTMSKVGKPNVTGVNVTPFVNVPQPVSQSSLLSQSLSVTNTTITGVLLSNSNTGIFSYNSSTGVYTVLKNSSISISASISATAAAAVVPVIQLNGQNIAISHGPAATNQWATTSFSGEVKAGSTFNVYNASTNASNSQVISVLATATSDTILTAPETFSTDTASLTYAPSSTYTLSTLANAPVGTFITFTYAANTNTRTQTVNTAPSQSSADMNANGMLLTARAYNAISTAALPAVFAIQIGKGLRGRSLDLYNSTGKGSPVSMDYSVIVATQESGVAIKTYNELTGILLVDAGFCTLTTSTSKIFIADSLGFVSNGYLVVNASKNPALTGVGIDRVAARGVSSSGQLVSNFGTILTYDAVKTFDTHGALNAATGVFTCPVSGYYQVTASVLFTTIGYTATMVAEIILFKNGIGVSHLDRFTVEATLSMYLRLRGSDTIYLNKGDTIFISSNNNRAATTALHTDPIFNYFSIAKISGIN